MSPWMTIAPDETRDGPTNEKIDRYTLRILEKTLVTCNRTLIFWIFTYFFKHEGSEFEILIIV